MNSVVKARIDSEIKMLAENNLQKAGLNSSSFIRLMYYSVAKGEFPFEVKVPNATTLRAMKELEEGGGKCFNSVEELMADLND